MEHLRQYRIEPQLAAVANHLGAEVRRIASTTSSSGAGRCALRRNAARPSWPGRPADRAVSPVPKQLPGSNRRKSAACGPRSSRHPSSRRRRGSSYSGCRRTSAARSRSHLHPLQGAQLPRGDDLLDAQSKRMVAIVKGLHHHPIRCGGQFGDLAGLGGIGGERLFAQHVLAGLERGPSPPAVQAVGQRVVDSVQIRVGDQRLVTVVHPSDVVLGGKGLSARTSRAATAATTTSPFPWRV